MNSDLDGGKTEIVIVRRRAADDAAGGKGGAWKIAYADFVTAMMAFFLVMWLINASNEATRAQVASYFNPIKLTDTSTGARSLKDMKDTRNPKSEITGETSEGSPPSKKDVKDEAEMLANPPKSLDRVAKTISEADYRNAGLENVIEIAPSLKPDQSNPGVGDPFDPRSWEAVAPAKVLALGSGAEKPAEKPPLSAPVDDTGTKAHFPATSAETAAKPNTDVPEEQEQEGNAGLLREAGALTKDIASRLGGSADQLSPSLKVKVTNAGVLISLTESTGFEMFKTGSAEPQPQLLQLIGAIAGAVKAHGGSIIVRGHTDSRPYRNKYYDNWQLSTARAHLARYMLIRGGVEAGRIRRVEGVADLEPLNSSDPQAPENRRIEIFVHKDEN